MPPDFDLPHDLKLPHEFKMWREFKAFLLKQNVLALAIAVVVGTATNSVVQGLVNDFIMPIVTAVTPAGAKWQDKTADVGRVHFAVGHFASVALNFILISFIAWQLTKLFIKPSPPAAQPATRQCPRCRMQIDALATRCPYCTSDLTPGK
ncbi:MAG TPA: MscL family protein [Gemmatimonadaceae bacterium]|nr:MscL family protein [Gemmatimonadaceae bacterium]